jgi:hypothetical protein
LAARRDESRVARRAIRERQPIAHAGSSRATAITPDGSRVIEGSNSVGADSGNGIASSKIARPRQHSW